MNDSSKVARLYRTSAEGLVKISPSEWEETFSDFLRFRVSSKFKRIQSVVRANKTTTSQKGVLRLNHLMVHSGRCQIKRNVYFRS